jgi:hypothetical protein
MPPLFYCPSSRNAQEIEKQISVRIQGSILSILRKRGIWA